MSTWRARAVAAIIVALGCSGCVSVSEGAERPTTPSTHTTAASTPSASVLADVGALLDELPVKGKAAKTGYQRTEKFGRAWIDVDDNGCDTRNDVLARDLGEAVMKGDGCTVLSGVLLDDYSGERIDFTRGQDTSAEVQIDHKVALLNAWVTGAQQLSQEERVALANDPDNLIAVKGDVNAQKGAGDAATWLPPNKKYRCEYVSDQVRVKAKYRLWVTPAEKDAITRELGRV
jgi:hypothetical protein